MTGKGCFSSTYKSLWRWHCTASVSGQQTRELVLQSLGVYQGCMIQNLHFPPLILDPGTQLTNSHILLCFYWFSDIEMPRYKISFLEKANVDEVKTSPPHNHHIWIYVFLMEVQRQKRDEGAMKLRGYHKSWADDHSLCVVYTHSQIPTVQAVLAYIVAF